MKKIIATALSIMMIVVMAMPVMASAEKDYKIGDCGWSTNGGRVEAFWEKAQSSTKYKITVYRQTNNGSKKAVYKETLSGTRFYVSPIIAFNGTGSYFFDVYPVKGGQELTVSSDNMDVDSSYLKMIEDQVKSDIKASVDAPAEPTYVWNKGPSGSWQLRKNGTLVTNQWAQVGGYWYLLDASGNMLKGWQQKDGKLYYLNENSGVGGYPEGTCMMNTVTPDGHRVDASGARIQ